jgi:2-polyprenyl-6-methoxyphenol hydroxylase-like FAD-dependent oxidoreductase
MSHGEFKGLHTQAKRSRTAVLIVGAGPVGLALAIELGLRGIDCVILERGDRVGRAPRAKTTHVRTREHLRRWGIAQELAARSPLGIAYPSDVIFVTRLAGYKLAHFHNAFHCAPERNSMYSEHAQWIPQYTLEEVLRARAARISNVRIVFDAEFVSAQQDENRVIATYRDANHGEATIEAQYLVGADGARSAVRALIGARMYGRHGLSRNYNFVFHAPGLAQRHAHGSAIMYWQVNAELPSLIGPMDSADTWFFMPTRLAEGVKLSKEDAAAAIHRATGINLPFDVIHADEWVASELIADKYRDRRIFLAGDACHLHPPFGGYGMNMGVADGVDLGWKLAAVIQGWGGERLLESYESERRPTHEYVIGEAVANHAALADAFWQEGLEAATEEGVRLRTEIGARITKAKAREFHNLGSVLGYRYENSPVVITDGSTPPVRDSQIYVPSSHPGCVAPHAWLETGSSLYDAFGNGFTLLTSGTAKGPETQSVVLAAHEVGLPLTVVEISGLGINALYPTAYTIVRPDQHVAWRGNEPPGRTILQHVAGLPADSQTS